jgi:hypothetical protein
MHKLTTRLCRENQAVVIEDLNVKGMPANERLAGAISDVGFGIFRPLMRRYVALRYFNILNFRHWHRSLTISNSDGDQAILTTKRRCKLNSGGQMQG